MLHMKYYIILLIGIFLSLGLGILIGVTLENKDVLEKQQILITRQIESEFSALRKEADMLKTSLEAIEKEKEQADSMCNYLFSRLTENRLMGISISMICMGADDACYELEEFLRLAGASIESGIIIWPELFRRRVDVTAVSEAFNEETKEPDRLYGLIAEELVFSIADGCATPLMNRIEEMHLISIINDFTESGGIDVIVLLGNGRDNESQMNGDQYFDIALIQAANNLGLQVIAVEPASIGRSAIPEYRNMGIFTVKNIDTIPGKLELIAVLESIQAGPESQYISDEEAS